MASPARTMNNFELLSFPDSHELAQAAAQAWLSEISSPLHNSQLPNSELSTPQLPVLRPVLRSAPGEGGSASDEGGSTYTVALSGGRITRNFFISIVNLLKTGLPGLHPTPILPPQSS